MLYLIITTILNFSNESATKYEYFNWHLTFENEKISELNDKGELTEKVWYANIHSYTKRKLSNNIYEEYFRINDTLFHYKKSNDSLIIDKGYFKINKDEIFTSDTIYIACRYGEWDDIIQIHNYHKPIKINFWKHHLSEIESFNGHYKEGKKHGKWIHKKEELQNKINFMLDDTLGIYNPSNKQVQNNLNWLLNKEFHICSKYLYQYDTLSTRILNKFPFRSNEYNKTCEDNLTFKFSKDSRVLINHTIKEAENSRDLSGIYKYEIDKDSKLILYLNQFGIISRKIKYFGKDEMK
jgi:hypothetical protein